MKRVVSLWFPTFATDRLARRRTPGTGAARSRPPANPPLATIARAPRGIRVVAVSPAAHTAGVVPGLSLAEARAIFPNLLVAPAEPAADRRALEALAEWGTRYTPWTAVDPDGEHPVLGGAGLWLDISGCAHLFGGEAALLDDLVGRLIRFGLAANVAVADTPGAAWAAARFSGDPVTAIPPDAAVAALADLPVGALRLPAEVIDGLHAVGLRRIGEVMALPRAPLAARFGEILPRRLDQASGIAGEPISPRLPIPDLASRLYFAEPIGRREDIVAANRHLLAELCGRLAAAHRGARRLELRLYRTDRTAVRTGIGTSRPVRDATHLERLFREKLDGVDAGFGIEAMVLGALVVEPLAPAQTVMGFARGRQAQAESVARLIDSLGNRLGAGSVVRLHEWASHIPERACAEVPALAGEDQPIGGVPARAPARPPTAGEKSRQPRPLHLLAWPEPIDVIAPVPDGPPAMFRWRRRQYRIAAAEGPERIGPEWWRQDGGHDPSRSLPIRDYYRIEDSEGRRFWVYREGIYRPEVPPRWFLHGLFP